MAERRMFAKTIIDSDAFLDMPLSTQALYFHLSMRADDEGFLNNAKKIMRTIGANQNDYDLLIAKRFIIQFPDGICVIKHWRIHNWIRGDRKKSTMYQNEMQMLDVKDSGAYTLTDECQTLDNQVTTNCHTQVRLGKDRLGKVSIEKDIKHKFGEFEHVLLKKSESDKLIQELGQETFDKCIKKLDEYIEQTGKKYKNHNLVIHNWVIKAVTEDKPKQAAKPAPKATGTKFNNFNQRTYDYDDLEKQLLNRGGQ